VEEDGKRRGRSRSKSKSRRREHERAVKVLGVGDESWSGEGNGGQEQMRMQRPRRTLPASPGVQRQDTQEQYNPWNAWQPHGQSMPQMGVAYPQPAAYPAMYPQPYQQPYQQAYTQAPQHASSFMMPQNRQQQPPPMAMPNPVPSSIPSVAPHTKHPRKSSTPRPFRPQAVPVPKPKPTHSREPRERKVDYIHIVDELPHIVKTALKKDRPASPAPSSSSSSSSGSAEEVPRTSIPAAPARFEMPFQFPAYPQMANRWGVAAPTSFPVQWSGSGNGNGEEGGVRNVRYACASSSPSARPRERSARSAEGNTPPLSNLS
jgi:hypothetical protein